MPYDPMEGFQVGQAIGKSKGSAYGGTAKYMSDLSAKRDEQANKVDPLSLLMVKSSIENPFKQGTLDEKKRNDMQRSWEKIIKNNDPMTASSRSTLGMAANANLRGDRALITLNNPKMTFQDAQNVVADVAGIYAGGAPTDQGMSHSQYETVQSRLANLQQFLSGKPGDAVSPEIKQHMKDVISDLKLTNNAAIKNHLNYQELANKDVISNYQDEWDSMKQSLLPDENGSQQPSSPLQQGIQNAAQQQSSPEDSLLNKWKVKYGRK